MQRRAATAIGRRGKGLHQRRAEGLQNSGRKGKLLPKYLSADEAEAVIRAAPNEDARLLMMLQWRAGLRITEALNITVPFGYRVGHI